MNPTDRQRGKHPNDDELFSAKWQGMLKEAVDDHSFLLSRGYGANSALELVGNQYRLNKRQRQALLRMSAAQHEIIGRKAKECAAPALVGNTIAIDGFNLLILLENAYSGAYGTSALDRSMTDLFSALFEREVSVFTVATGTAAN